jgi:hypothetical protein
MKVDTEAQFLDGHVDRVSVGAYGRTVRLVAAEGEVLILTNQPRRRQRTIGPDTPRTRRLGLEAARKVVARLPGSRRTTAIEVRQIETAKPELTPADIWTLYLRTRLGEGAPADLLGMGDREIESFLASLPKAALYNKLSHSYIRTTLQAARRLDRDRVIPLAADFDRIQAADLNRWAQDALDRGASPHTVDTYLRRFQSAVAHVREQHPQAWKGRTDPTRNLVPIDKAAITPPELDEPEARRLIDAIQGLGDWRLLSASVIAWESGRRIGSIAGGNTGLHLSAPPLCASDFTVGSDGKLQVRWRAAVQKGRAYRKGDQTTVVSQAMARVYDDLVLNHPNPLGGDFPLVWSERDPARAESYARLSRGLARAWEEAFGLKKPKGFGFHAFCRATVTTITNELGLEAAAEYTGRTVETAGRIYLAKSRSQTLRAAEALNRLRGREGG